MKMNIYAHMISCQRNSDMATVSTVMTSISPTMEDSVEFVYAAGLKRWPLKDFSKHQVMTESSHQIYQEWIDIAASK